MFSSALYWPLTLVAVGAPVAGVSPAETPAGLTAVDGVRVGHHTRTDRPTGCTVILVEDGAVAAVDVRGGAPGTRETDLLNPVNLVQEAHAIVLAGGSAFGLDTASGVMRFLEERGVGHATSAGKVPIVPAAIIFDLGVGDAKIRPTADDGYKAAQVANDGPVAEGAVGAGAGARVGKMGGPDSAMPGGVGTSAIVRRDGLVVAALIVVNAFGDIVDPANGEVVAGARGPDGSFLDARRLLRRETNTEKASVEPGKTAPRSGENTTIGVVATNARLTQAEATKVAQMAQDGLARTTYPAHTPYDGDTIFVLATGHHQEDVNLMVVGALAADAVAEAVLRGVQRP